jgi:hypothetical protein
MRRGQDDSTKGCPRCRKLEKQLLAARSQIERLTVAVGRMAQLEGLLEDSRQLIARLNERVEQLEAEANRQAARFRVPESKRKRTKGKPGRKRGHEPAYRQPPPSVDEFAEVPLERCPHCGGPVHDVHPVEQIIEDIPPIQVHRLRLITYRGRCERCGSVCSRHPQQVSDATGAAGTHLGRRALGLAAYLNKQLGLTMRKTTALLDEHFGLRLSPGGLSQALVRIAGKLQPAFDELRGAVRTSEAIHADETSWWVGGQSAWLWVFTNPRLTLYTIGDRSQQVVRRVLGDDYPGVLISDCLSSYDPHPGRKSKCCAHHLKAISEARAQAPDSDFLAQIRALLKAAMLLHRVREHVDAADWQKYTGHLERNLDRLLALPGRNDAEQRIVNRLTKQREHLLTFLHVPGVDPTNNLAERQLRPAVIARKLSCGNKTASGAHSFEVLSSLAATCRQQGYSFARFVADCLSLDRAPPSLLAAH